MLTSRSGIRRSCGIPQAFIAAILILCILSFIAVNFETKDVPSSPLDQVLDASKVKILESEANASYARKPFRTYVYFDVVIDGTNAGRITAELYTDLVPKTVENFRALMTGELGATLAYKGSVCHRIIQDFIVQCGDYTQGTGYGGKSIYGGPFDDEPNGLRLKHSKRYILQMANSGPNTNGSQFCIMLGPAPHLNGKHVIFGEVIEGFHVVDQMEAAGVQRDGIKLAHVVQIVDGGEILAT